jgi:hypothetical protein
VKGRKQCVMDTIRNHDLDFIGIQETKTKKNFQLLRCFSWEETILLELLTFSRINW